MRLINKISNDKYAHFIACQLITWAVSKVMQWCGVSVVLSILAGVFAAMLVGACKELYDKVVQHETFDIEDIKADALGAVVGAVMSM